MLTCSSQSKIARAFLELLEEPNSSMAWSGSGIPVVAKPSWQPTFRHLVDSLFTSCVHHDWKRLLRRAYSALTCARISRRSCAALDRFRWLGRPKSGTPRAMESSAHS